jgi:hypothetical protein
MSMEKSYEDVFSSIKTSAKLLAGYARVKLTLMSEGLSKDEIDKNYQLFLLVYDLYIKANSYAILNKIAFNLAIIFGLMVLIWPSVAILSHDYGWEKEFLKSAVVQTTITGIAALMFAIYSHYKKRQVITENLMRYALFSKDSLQLIEEKVLQEMARIDTGFSFSQTVLKHGQSNDEN